MNQSKITVIVPCYNVEKYVQKSIESLLNQTYKNLEIIVIDDCSTDNTYSVLKELLSKNKDKFTLYQNDKNRGLAYTRNRGISLASSKYIGFIDSDDYIDTNYYETLMNIMKKENAEIVISDMQFETENEKTLSTLGTTIDVKNRDIKLAVIDTGVSASACNKLFKKETIEKYPFPEGKVNEDIATTFPAILHANSVAYTDKVKYHYIQRNNSIQNSEFSEKRFDIIQSVELTLERIKDVENYEESKNIILYHQILMLYVFVITPLKGFKNRQKYLKMFIKKQSNIRIEKNKTIVKRYLSTLGKFKKIYWYMVINLLRLKSATLINLLISMAHIIVRLRQKTVIKKDITFLDIINVAKKQKEKRKSKISISAVVPNYNYQEFLLQRVYSILYQTKKIEELILLDDCSTDNSREIIDELVEKLKPYIKVRKVYNEQNTGIAFKQWKKGFELAEGDYVWIAEADDFCDKNMLKKLIKQIKKDKKTMIAYVDTAFIDTDGKIVLKSIKPEIDIRKTGHWNHSYINNGQNELQDYTFLNCTIANVSSCLIKNGDYREIFEKAETYMQSGDWVFYTHLMTLGNIAYVNKPYNYYRIHGNNISSVMDKKKHLEEIKKIHNGMRDLTSITSWHEKEFQKRYEFLEKVWNLKEKED